MGRQRKTQTYEYFRTQQSFDIKNNSTTFYQFTKSLIKEFIQSKRIGNTKIYRFTLNVIKNFRNDKYFTFNKLNLDLPHRFERYHLAWATSWVV